MVEQGVKLWGAAETLRHLIGVPISMADRARYDRAVVRAREELGEQVFARAWAEGNQLTTEDAIDYALELILELPSRLSPEER